MKSFFAVSAVAFAAALSLTVSPVQASDPETSENRPVNGAFHGINLMGSTDVIVRQGDKASITVNGPADEVAHTETTIEKDRLVIRQKDWKSWNIHTKGVTVIVVMPALEAIAVTGSGDLRTEGKFTGTDLSVSLTGSGDLRLGAELTGTLTTAVVGSGDVRLTGSCASHNIKVSGSGDVSAADLKAASASVKVSGSGDVSVTATESLEASISGSGDIRYGGNPKQLIKHVSGSGSIARL